MHMVLVSKSDRNGQIFHSGHYHDILHYQTSTHRIFGLKKWPVIRGNLHCQLWCITFSYNDICYVDDLVTFFSSDVQHLITLFFSSSYSNPTSNYKFIEFSENLTDARVIVCGRPLTTFAGYIFEKFNKNYALCSPSILYVNQLYYFTSW